MTCIPKFWLWFSPRVIIDTAPRLPGSWSFDMNGKEDLVVYLAGFLSRPDRSPLFILNRRIGTMLKHVEDHPRLVFPRSMRLMVDDRHGYLLEDVHIPMNHGVRPYTKSSYLRFPYWHILSIDPCPQVDARTTLDSIREGKSLLKSYTYRGSSTGVSTWKLCSVTLRTLLPSGSWLVGYVNNTAVVGKVGDDRSLILHRTFQSGDNMSFLNDHLCEWPPHTLSSQRVIRILLFHSRSTQTGNTEDTPHPNLWRVLVHNERIYIEDVTRPWEGGYRKAFRQFTWYPTRRLPGLYFMHPHADVDMTLDVRDLVVSGRECPYGSTATFGFQSCQVCIETLNLRAPFPDGTILFGALDKRLAFGFNPTPYTPKICGRVHENRVQLFPSFDDGHIKVLFGALAVFSLVHGTFITEEAGWRRSNIRLTRGEITNNSNNSLLRVKLHRLHEYSGSLG